MTAAGPDRAAGASGGALEPARVAAPPVRPGVRALARAARPVAGLGSLLLVEILSNPRARAAAWAAARGVALSLGRRPAPGTAAAGPVTTRAPARRSAVACHVVVIEEPAATSVLVRCVETRAPSRRR